MKHAEAQLDAAKDSVYGGWAVSDGHCLQMFMGVACLCHGWHNRPGGVCPGWGVRSYRGMGVACTAALRCAIGAAR